MADIDNFANSWEVLDHGQVEDAIKAKAAQLEAAINSVVPSSGITQEMLAAALRQTIANAVPNSRKINGVSLNRDITLGPENISVGNITLAQKLDDLGSAIEGAAQSGSITMEDVNEALQDYQPKLLAGTGIAINSSNQISVETGSVAANEDKPVSGGDVFQALDGITAGQTVVINSDGANIVDDYSDSVLIATSARKVKELYLNLHQLYTNLANMAFTNGKPSWITVAKRQYDLSLASSGNDGLSKVYIVNGDTDASELTTTATKVNEGAVKLRLVPTTSNFAFTHIIVNSVDIAQTAVDAEKGDGSVYVTFILNTNATISAIASSGVTVSMGSSTNCSMNIAPQVDDENFSRQITASSHYTLPSAIMVKLNGTTALASGTDYTYTRANDNKTATLEIDKSKFANATSIEVTCQADPVASCTVSWSQVDMIVKHGNDVLFNNGNLATPSVTVYADDLNYALTFEAALGKKFTTAPNINGTDLIGSNGVYTLTVNNFSNYIEVDAAVGELETYGVSLIDTASSEDPNETPYTEGNLKMFSDAEKTTRLTVSEIDIDEGGSFTCYLGSDEATTGTSKEIVWDILNGTDYPVKVEMESNGTLVDITSTAFIQKGLLLMVNIPNVTGNIVITGRTMVFALGKSYAKTSLGNNNGYCVTDYIPIAGASKLVIYGRFNDTVACAVVFDDNKDNASSWKHNIGYRQVPNTSYYYRETLEMLEYSTAGLPQRKFIGLFGYNDNDGYYPVYIGILGDRSYIRSVANGGYGMTFGQLPSAGDATGYGVMTDKLDVQGYTKLTYITCGTDSVYYTNTQIKQYVGNTAGSNLSGSKTRIENTTLGSGVTSIQPVMLLPNRCYIFGCDSNGKWHVVFMGSAFHAFIVNTDHIYAQGTGDRLANPTILNNNGAERTFYIYADEGYEFTTPTEAAPTVTMNGVNITNSSIGGSVTWDSENSRYIMHVPFLGGDIEVTASNVQVIEATNE